MLATKEEQVFNDYVECVKGIFMDESKNLKAYFCDKCEEEVYSLICRRIDGEDYDVCSECYEEEVSQCL